MIDDAALAKLYPSCPPASTLPAQPAAAAQPASADATKLYPSSTAAAPRADSAEAASAPAQSEPLYAEVPPELANVNFDEPRAVSATDYQAAFDRATAPDPAQLDAGLSAALAMGVGVTQLRGIVELELAAVRQGEALTEEAGMQGLRAMWGERTDERVAIVREYATTVAQKWPGFGAWLESTRLGNSTPFVRLMYERAIRAARNS